eukprot:TRINITY_DN1334_c0_g1_i1.p1 TRINITY_DN1334_c0_g1~~TRINITY_DN1334_c0_g1_i1.p1  ORF type:complete len:254 (-),score=40.66 TRINITY_DN1334_c0_g1_i1:327-1088(-)
MVTAAGECEAQWPTVTAVEPLKEGSGGIVVRLDGQGLRWAATAQVTIACDASLGPVLVDGNDGLVAATTQGLGNYSFRLSFSSGCACGKGCTSASCFVGPKPWYNIQQVQLSARAVVDGTPKPASQWAFSPCGGATLCQTQTSTDDPFAGVLQSTWLPSAEGSGNSNSTDCADWGPVSRTALTDTGIQLNVTKQFGDLQATVVIDIACDPQTGGVVRDANYGQVVVTTVRPGQQVARLSFISGCACGDGCLPQ